MDGASVGLAGAAQVFRINSHVDYVRRGEIYKTTEMARYGVTSLTAEEAPEAKVLDLVRGYWSIETRQHFRRDATQREDYCSVRRVTAARNLSLMRSTAIFLYEHQRSPGRRCRSLARREQQIMCSPNAMIAQLCA